MVESLNKTLPEGVKIAITSDDAVFISASIEEVLITHPEVSLAAVIGVPHESHGEEVKAVVIRTPGSTLSEDDLIAWGKEQMAAYKYPRIVEFRDALPMTATGKILKREL